jgi:hypothetical protein
MNRVQQGLGTFNAAPTQDGNRLLMDNRLHFFYVKNCSIHTPSTPNETNGPNPCHHMEAGLCVESRVKSAHPRYSAGGGKTFGRIDGKLILPQSAFHRSQDGTSVMLTQPTPPTTHKQLTLQHQAANLVYSTNSPDQLAHLLASWGWQRQRPFRREAYRLTRGESHISIDIAGGVVALGPGAVAALALALLEVHHG